MHREIDFSQQVKEILNRNNIQIRSLGLLDADTKNLFLLHRKKAILLIRSKVYEREINAMDDNTIDVFDSLLNPYLKIGQLVLLVLPAEKGKRFVLQTSVKNIFVDRFRLVSLDPRKNQRFPLAEHTPVLFRVVPDSLAMGIQHGELRTIRDTTNIIPDGNTDTHDKNASTDNTVEKIADTDKMEFANKTASKDSTEKDASRNEEKNLEAEMPPHNIAASVHDIIFQKNENKEADEYLYLKKQPGSQGTILDISLGGMCIEQSQDSERLFADQLIALETTLKTSEDNVTLNLFLFAVVRNVQEINSQIKVNLQFLSMMPRAAVQYFPICPQ